MTAINQPLDREAFIARLATTAYQVALRHGIKGSFAELELNLWHAMRSVCTEPDVMITEDRRQWPQ